MLYEEMVLLHEQKTRKILFSQVTGPGGMRGAFPEGDGVPDTRRCGFALAHLAEAFLIPGNGFYHSPRVKDALETGLAFLTSHLRPGGCMDLTSCNFASAPDTAFTLNEIIVAWWLLEKDESGEAEWLRAPLKALIGRCGEGVMNGGFHTPNHRWAIASCLLHAARICGRDDFSRRAQTYLGEGLDINAEGEFAERSGGIYNLVNDDQMIRLYLATGDSRYLEAARSNLRMMLSYIDPDGSVFTGNSTRQDRGKKVYLDGYYRLFLLTGYLLGDEELAAYSEYCRETAAANGRTPDCLAWLALYPDLEEFGRREKPDLTGILRCRKLFAPSGIARIRRGDWSCSLMREKPDFLYFQHGGSTICLAVYQNVCDRRNFAAETLEETERGYRMTARADSWYYLPFEGKGPDTSDWWAMDNARTRERMAEDSLRTEIEVIPEEDGVELVFRSEGLSGVPVRLEWGLPAGERLRNENFCLETSPGGQITVGGGRLEIGREEGEILTIDPCFAEHDSRARMSGAFQAAGERFTVYMTAFSPFERRIHLGTKPLFPKLFRA